MGVYDKANRQYQDTTKWAGGPFPAWTSLKGFTMLGHPKHGSAHLVKGWAEMCRGVYCKQQVRLKQGLERMTNNLMTHKPPLSLQNGGTRCTSGLWERSFLAQGLLYQYQCSSLLSTLIWGMGERILQQCTSAEHRRGSQTPQSASSSPTQHAVTLLKSINGHCCLTTA